jgi:membrane-associated protease RseP (regulator of RpoE activity)
MYTVVSKLSEDSSPESPACCRVLGKFKWPILREHFFWKNSLVGLAVLLIVWNLNSTQKALAQTSNWDQYVTGMTVIGRPNGGASCPPIVWTVAADSPAAKVGIEPGDVLLSIDGHRNIDIGQVLPLLRTTEAKPSSVELEGEKGPYTVEVGRIKASEIFVKQGLKQGPEGSLFPSDATDLEMQRVSKIQSEPPRDKKVFNVGHYPDDMDIYYPGFELFVWDAPNSIMVGGIEVGPAKKAGIHYGDSMVSVNGVSPSRKSIAELEKLFSSNSSTNMKLVVDRDGVLKTFNFPLEKAADIAAENHKRRYEGKMVPAVIPDKYLHCWKTQ